MGKKLSLLYSSVSTITKASIMGIAFVSFALAAPTLDSNPNFVKLKNFKPNPKVESKQCLSCHKSQDPGIVSDWQHSVHAKNGVGCVQCHVVPKDYPNAFKAHPFKGANWTVQAAVSSVTCAKCHAKETKEFMNSGHARAGAQWLKENGNPHGKAMTKLAYGYEGMRGGKGVDKEFSVNKDNPKADLTVANICVQCHGTIIKLDSTGKPLATTWPSDGIGSLYPDGGVGNCVSCHSRHKFSAKEARQPAACGNCHLGPDHPDKEIFESSVHGHIFDTNEEAYNFDTGKQIPGKTLRAATCFTCHMSSINDSVATHNVSARLKWNLWAPKSFERSGGAETAGWAWWHEKKVLRGNAKAGNPQGADAARSEMKQVCASCHDAAFTSNYFGRVDADVHLYNQYRDMATKMYNELKAKGLIKKDVWSDPFFKLLYYAWHHEGRRMRQGAAMGSPDYAHWHGVFQVMQDIREMKDIYNYRMRMLKKLNDPQKVLEQEPPMPVVTHE
jgi:hydroxylamine dehydrogenase